MHGAEHAAVIGPGHLDDVEPVHPDPAPDEHVVELGADPARGGGRPGGEQPLPGRLARVGAARRARAERGEVRRRVQVAEDGGRPGRGPAPALQGRELGRPGVDQRRDRRGQVRPDQPRPAEGAPGEL